MNECAGIARGKRMESRARELCESGLDTSLAKAFEAAQEVTDADVRGRLVEALAQVRTFREDIVELSNTGGLNSGSKIFEHLGSELSNSI
jgi:hypothetical protein